MSHSRIFDDYARLMTDKNGSLLGHVKTAGKKDEDYNTLPDSAGPDTKIEKDGWELVELAHPDQIQVAQSRLNDGIVENGVETQKTMIDVALRNPRGVLASNLIKTLVKAANTLDLEMTDESLKMASEIDVVLKKLAADALSSENIYPLVEEVLNRFGDLDFSTAGYSSEKNKAAKQAIYQTSLVLKKFLQNAKYAGKNIEELIQGLATYIRGADATVKKALQNTTDWGSDDEEALNSWDNLKLVMDEWYQEPVKRPGAESAAPGVASKETAHPEAPTHHTFLKTTEVGELQDALGLTGGDRDEKFGPHTFGKLEEAAKTNSLLDQALANKSKNYADWTNADIGDVLKRVHDGAVAKRKDQVLTPYTSYEEGFQASKKV